MFAILLCNTLQLLASPQYFGSWVFFDGHLWEKGYNVYLCIGKENPENPMQDSVRFYQLNRVRNTQRFYSKNKSETVPEWEGASYFAMIATSSTYTKSNGKNIPITLHYTYDEIISQAKHYTAKYTEDYHIDPKQSGLYYISLTQVGDNMYTMSIDKKNNKSIIELTIHEGRNHQVRKMFEAVGYDVLKLKREKYANLDLKGLKPGEYRKLSVHQRAVQGSFLRPQRALLRSLHIRYGRCDLQFRIC